MRHPCRGCGTSPRSTATSTCLTAALDDLGLVVEGVERVGEGLEDVVVARVAEIAAIEGADRIRRVVVDAGDGPLEIVCGACELRRRRPGPAGPGGRGAARRHRASPAGKMRGVESNGMLCSGRELGLIRRRRRTARPDRRRGGRGRVGRWPRSSASSPTSCSTSTVEGNRPDAWCIAGVARDLAARLGLPFAAARPAASRPRGRHAGGRAGHPGGRGTELCPRMIVRVLSGWRSGRRPAGSPAGWRWPACGRSTTWSTRPTT